MNPSQSSETLLSEYLVIVFCLFEESPDFACGVLYDVVLAL